MPVRKANAVWKGTLKEGNGTMRVGSGLFEGSYSAGTRFEQEPGTNPEELIGAAHAGCFSMAFSLELGNAGYTPESIETQASVNLEKKGDGFAITWIELSTEAKVPGIDEATFTKIAEGAKSGCPVSQALAGPEIRLKAKLVT
jgi:osmotically inducible protein OsmC